MAQAIAESTGHPGSLPSLRNLEGLAVVPLRLP